MKKNKCLFCGAPATLLCDGHLGYPPAAADQLHRAFNGLDLFRPYTCDAPMCDSCRALQARYILCRRGKGCQTDTIDLCPGCIALKAEQKGRRPERRRIDSEEQANTLRASHWRTWQKGELVEVIEGGGQINLF